MVLDFGIVFDKRTPQEKKIYSINSRREATQEINPITGKKVYISNDLLNNGIGTFYGSNQSNYKVKVGRFEDPIQAHLRVMEDLNPSSQLPETGLIKSIGDRFSLLNRALQYRNGSQHIWRESKEKFDKGFRKNIKNLNSYNVDRSFLGLLEQKINSKKN